MASHEQISLLKGQLKAPRRNKLMRERYDKRMVFAERRYQEQLAKELTKYL